jgi:hypothetical protein
MTAGFLSLKVLSHTTGVPGGYLTHSTVRVEVQEWIREVLWSFGIVGFYIDSKPPSPEGEGFGE